MTRPSEMNMAAWLYPEDEGELLQAAQRDPAIFLALCQPLLEPLFHYFSTQVTRPADAEQLTARALSATLRDLLASRPGRNFSTRLFTIVRRIQPGHAHAGMDYTGVEEELHRLDLTLLRLDPSQRELLALRYAALLSVDKIARLLRRPESAVEHDLHAALAGMEAAVLGYEPEARSGAPSAVLESSLVRLFAAVQPSPGFEERVEEALTEAAAQPAGRAQPLRSGWLWVRRRAGLVGLSAIMLAVMALTIYNPQQALETAQSFLARLPGVNYINLDGTRVLDEPAVGISHGMQVIVTRVLASGQSTRVTFSTLGMPELQPEMNVSRAQFALRLPDGRTLNPDRMELSLGEARLDFPAIPLGVMDVDLWIQRLPLAGPGEAPEDWLLPLSLRKANAANPAERAPQTITPEEPTSENNGLAITVNSVSLGVDETGVEMALESDHPGWTIDSSRVNPTLYDGAGHALYPRGSKTAGLIFEQTGGPFGSEPLEEDEGVKLGFRFAPMADASQPARLVLEEIPVRIPVGASFTFKPGDGFLPGKRWTLNQTIEVAGAKLHLEEARLLESSNGAMYMLTFGSRISGPDGQRLESLRLSAASGRVMGPVWTSAARMAFGISLSRVPQDNVGVRINIDEAIVMMQGPWEVSWQADGDAVVQAAEPVTQPAEQLVTAQDQAANGVRLALRQAELGDRSTHLRLAVSGLPDGQRLIGLFNELEGQTPLSLEDEWGVRQELNWDVEQHPGGELELVFPPAQGEGYALNVPALRVSMGVEDDHKRPISSMQVVVPGSRQMSTRLVTRSRSDSLIAPVQYTLLSSREWDVYLTARIGDFPVVFTEAHLEQAALSDTEIELVLTGSAVESAHGRAVGMHVARVDVPGESPLSEGSGYVVIDPNSGEAELRMPVSVDNEVVPGIYTIRFDRVEALVRGPWRMEWGRVR